MSYEKEEYHEVFKDHKELDPMCFKGFPMAITNEEVLLPCCYCDTVGNLKDPVMQKLVAVSNLNDYDRIEDILFQPEWREFYRNLKQHKGPPACLHTCSTSKTTIRQDVWVDTEKGGTKKEVKFGSGRYNNNKDQSE